MRPPTAVDLSVLHQRNVNTYYAKSVAGAADVTLTSPELAAGSLEFTGPITANISVIFVLAAENQGQYWKLKNSTSGPFKLTVKATGQTGFPLERFEMVSAVFNGTDMLRSAPQKLSRRYELKWVACQRGKPSLNADIQSATEAVREIADPDFEVLGTNMTSALSTFNAEGGNRLTTAGADNDQAILLPHLDANQSPWTQITWGTDQETEWECHLKTGAAITNQILWAGLKLTNTPTAATDNDSVYLRYQNGVNGGRWQALYSIANADTAVDTGIPVALSTEYHVRIAIDAARVARVYLNGLLVATTTALTDATDFIPYIGVQASGEAAAKSLIVFGEAISRKYA